MTEQGWLRGAYLALLSAGLIAAVGCVTVDWGNGDGTGGDPNKITVWLFNASTSLAVDPLFYATSEAVVDPNTDLFVSANKVAGIGFAGTGLIPKGQSEKVTLDCSKARVLGTPGARFVDEDSGKLQGRGDQIILNQTLQFNCGAKLTFTFRATAGGSYETTYKVE